MTFVFGILAVHRHACSSSPQPEASFLLQLPSFTFSSLQSVTQPTQSAPPFSSVHTFSPLASSLCHQSTLPSLILPVSVVISSCINSAIMLHPPSRLSSPPFFTTREDNFCFLLCLFKGSCYLPFNIHKSQTRALHLAVLPLITTNPPILCHHEPMQTKPTHASIPIHRELKPANPKSQVHNSHLHHHRNQSTMALLCPQPSHQLSHARAQFLINKD